MIKSTNAYSLIQALVSMKIYSYLPPSRIFGLAFLAAVIDAIQKCLAPEHIKANRDKLAGRLKGLRDGVVSGGGAVLGAVSGEKGDKLGDNVGDEEVVTKIKSIDALGDITKGDLCLKNSIS